MYQEEYKRWLEADLEDADLSPELARIEGNDEEIKDRFAVALKFGTAGLRGVLGAGTNRMNIYVVRQATQGLANWVKTQGGTQTVAISYDSRLKSDVFAKTAAGVLAANGINVRIYDALMPVPALSFATRYYNCNAGVMVTASHNPAKYNGYKAYGPDGCQMTDDAAAIVYAEIQKTEETWIGVRCISRAKSAALVCVASISLFTGGCIGGKGATPVTAYELKNYNQDLYQGKLYAEELCVAQNDVALEGYTEDTELHSAALFDLTGERVLYSYKAHERLYPASTTKIMTALLAIENANLDDQVTISGNADASSFPADAQVCGLAKGEVWTLRDLLGALLLYSGNDAATAIAEYVGGSEEAFVNMMNRRAQELMANGTHFMNPHGLHDDNHYTTAYDLYLIFNECIKHEDFVNIIQSEAYTAYYTDVDGNSQPERKCGCF